MTEVEESEGDGECPSAPKLADLVGAGRWESLSTIRFIMSRYASRTSQSSSVGVSATLDLVEGDIPW